MASGVLKQGKKRFFIALEQKPYEELNALLAQVKAPRGSAASMLDDFIRTQVIMFRRMIELQKEGKELTYREALVLLSKIQDAIENES